MATRTDDPALHTAYPYVGSLPGLIKIPCTAGQLLEMRYASLLARDRFLPEEWYRIPLQPSAESDYVEIDLDQLNLVDGVYEYEFIIDGRDDQPVVDPFAEELTRFGGYRGLFRIVQGKRQHLPFSWEDELNAEHPLPDNHQMVIYEMPLRWMTSPQGETGRLRQVGLGTFEGVIFRHLDELSRLGISTIELLPVQDSADTLNWGYGSRFFFCPDFDMGSAVDLKVFIKCCHQKGMRVILDVVMNHARECPLEQLAYEHFFLHSRDDEPGRGEDYGARLFRFREPSEDGRYWAREFHYSMAAYWIENYHVDGFRIDEFRGIDNWDFIQTFTEKAGQHQQTLFPQRPFIVIAEDSWRRPEIVRDDVNNPHGRKVVHAMWNFSFRDELRRLLVNGLYTQWGQPGRRQRIEALVTGHAVWDDLSKRFKTGFQDMAQAINYTTSHDVEGEIEKRLLNYVFSHLIRQRGLGEGDVEQVRNLIEHMSTQPVEIQQAHQDALDRVRSAFCILMTAVGVPMFLAGEEFADCHDLEHGDWRLKMSDPIDWRRSEQPGHNAVLRDVTELIQLRKSHAALLRNDTSFFYCHPQTDHNDGVRVFAYCRTAGRALGERGQVLVIANMGEHHFPRFDLPCFWQDSANIVEHAIPRHGIRPQFNPARQSMSLSLSPFQVRVFST